ncbi:MAG: hypothetical protein CR982_04035 [Candidatus Cloacimonadota bacterium]|nr:MAG: hypothetical protein CR982_04035 [Candidatus Cloacimonadota bacterium]PIE77477.1 MAG: hypothetical protein CSA15_12735 [Candidatus Delongbacteria bacterium]
MYYIFCVDDQPEVLASVKRELSFLDERFEIIDCESAEDALAEFDEIDEEPALIICDHIMPEKTGVEFLYELKESNRFKFTKKILLTGLASHQDTIDAINKAGIDAYISKPWETELLIKRVKECITNFIFDTGDNYLEFTDIMDKDLMLQKLQR